MVHRKLLKALRAACPTITVRVRFIATPKLWGDCDRKNGYFLVRVHPKASYKDQVDTLVHEFAHAESYLEWEETGEHGPMFGIAYAKFYRVMESVLH
jgi:hypothetical protein